MNNRLKRTVACLLMTVTICCFTACTPPIYPDLDGEESHAQSEAAVSSPHAEPDRDPEAGNSQSHILVVCFSATGNTQALAQYAARYLGADLYTIQAKVPYTADDLNYTTDCRANREQNDPSCRPEIAGNIPDMNQYNTVLIGYPIWHGQAPRIICTFLEGNTFHGKTIIPFCTSASSGIGSSAINLHASAPDAEWLDGKRFASDAGNEAVCAWIAELGLSPEKEETNMKIYCGENALSVNLADNPSAKAFAEKLKEGDITVTMNDYGNFEKVGSLPWSLPQTDTRITTAPGDVILYLGSNITIYYDVNRWSFTLLGKIPGMTRETMLSFFGGQGEVTVRFSLN